MGEENDGRALVRTRGRLPGELHFGQLCYAHARHYPHLTDVTGHFDFDLKIEWSGRLLHLFASSREKIIGGWEGGAHLSGTLPRITSLK